jgi:hypothetical protein
MTLIDQIAAAEAAGDTELLARLKAEWDEWDQRCMDWQAEQAAERGSGRAVSRPRPSTRYGSTSAGRTY